MRRSNPGAKGFAALTPNDWVSFVYLAVAVGIVPLIVRLALVSPNADEQALFLMEELVFDIFVYNKSVLLIGATILALAAYSLFYKSQAGVAADLRSLVTFTKGTVITGMHVKLAVLLGVIFTLSAIFSDYRQSVLWGASQRFEGLAVLLCYIVVFFVACSFCRTRFNATLLLAVVAASSLVIGVLAVMQYLGRDFFLSPLGTRLAFGRFYFEGAQFTPHFIMAYSTLYNPNYLGQYAAMTLPLFVFGALAFGRRSKMCWALAALSALMLVSLLASGSSGALLALSSGVGLAFALTIIFFMRKGFTRVTLIGLGAALAATAAVAVIPVVNYNILRMIDRFASGTDVEGFFFRDAAVGSGFASVTTRYGELRLELDEAETGIELSFQGERLAPLDVFAAEEDPNLRESIFSVPYIGYVSVVTSGSVVVLLVRHAAFNFLAGPEGEFFMLTAVGEVVDINQPVPSIGFEGFETFGSSRGYIWSRTLPVVLAAPLLGYGPDAFSFAFPQHDILGKLHFHDKPYILVDKPHNIYLQFAVNTGILSAMALIALIALFGLRAVWRIFTDSAQTNFTMFMRLGLLVGMFVFAVSGLSTDSNVNTSPVFWGLLGMGYALID